MHNASKLIRIAPLGRRCRPPAFPAREFVASSVAAAPAEKHNWLLRMLGYYGEESTRIRNAEAIFQSCSNQSNRKAWYGRGQVSKDFRPKHAMIMTHIWLVYRRLDSDAMGNEKANKLLQEAVFDLVWEDTQFRIRNVVSNELLLNKNLKEVQKYTFPMLYSFDQALAATEEEKRLDHLGAALWRNVWGADRKMTVEHCMEMAKYIQTSRAVLEATDIAAVTEGRIPWGEIPSW